MPPGSACRGRRRTARYRDEVIAVLHAEAPDLHDALSEVAEQGWSHVIVDGKVFRTDRCAETTTTLDIGYLVICEGILHRSRYGPMLTDLCEAHRGTTSVFYLDTSFDETLRRHTSRPQAHEFTPEDMRGWYLPHDVLGVPGEHIIDENTPLEAAVRLVGEHLPPISCVIPGAVPPASR